ncbi:hypothetical protein JHK85_032881 [Glycine max]|nr:hypothetical protein JHK85_032881 [Glycine max]
MLSHVTKRKDGYGGDLRDIGGWQSCGPQLLSNGPRGSHQSFDCVKMTQQNVVVSDTKSGVSLTVFSTTQKPPAAPGGYISIPRRRVLKNLEINGGQRINAWVESMRASSPTHHKSTPSLSQEHNSWILHHPSALDMFDQIIDASKGKQIVMFLDYDGTLSPIVDDPDRAFMSDSMRKTVRKLARCFPTAIVTGRCKDKVYNFVRLAELYYAGSHGMDIKGPTRSSKYNKDSKAEAILCQPASDFLPMIDEVYQQLVEKTKSTPGALVENNKFCLSVHFRCVDEKKLRDRGQGFGILVSKFPKDTSASYSLQEPNEVMNFLQRLVEWKHVSLRARS